MGFELETFVHPDRISSQLICPICTCVLEHPVQTPSEHLFCEEELLEWMTRSTVCPITKQPLDPHSIKRPGRIILNMLDELERYCPYRSEGCRWTGIQSTMDSHRKQCRYRPREEILLEVDMQAKRIQELEESLRRVNRENTELRQEKEQLMGQLEVKERKLRVYDAFFKDEAAAEDAHETSLQRIARLRRLETFHK